ncbi:hypothetical protein BJ170DRAFT_607441 [Xylariales sp. AK1849]|nr:hypothetical protein BJ170DRAFT_607441 [Xylariales sp. AK1849]
MSSQLENEAAFESRILGFIYRQWLLHRKPVPAGTDLAGQTAIITGANGGLGLESAKQLLQLGLSKLVMAVRSEHKGKAAADGLRRDFSQAHIEVWVLDMEDYESIKAFATKCGSLNRIDIALLNAGLLNQVFRRSPATNHEQLIQVNYISTALLSILLLPVLKAKRPSPTKPGLLCLVTSDTAYWAKLENNSNLISQFDKEEAYSGFHRYMTTKLFEQFFVVKLAENISADDVIINMVNPGLCTGTALSRDSARSILFGIFERLMARSLEVGGSTYVDAVALKGKESHGSFVSDWSIRPYPSILYTKHGQEIKERLWEETMEELNFAGASKIVQDMRQ